MGRAGVFASGLLLTEPGSAMAHRDIAMSSAVLRPEALTPFVDAPNRERCTEKQSSVSLSVARHRQPSRSPLTPGHWIG